MRRRGVADPCVLLLVADDLRDIGTRLLRAFEGAQHRCAGRASPNDTHAYHRAEIPAVGKNFTFVRWYLPRGERATLCSITPTTANRFLPLTSAVFVGPIFA